MKMDFAGIMGDVAKKAAHKKKRNLRVKKAPGAPKRFKSSYIHFFMHVHDGIKKALPEEEATAPLISKRASQMWKNLPASERKYWDDLAANEKKLYLEQKKEYKGPWKIPNKRVKKDPAAPKRNPSAFLLFASTRRNVLQDKYSHLDNTAVSRILGHEWRTMAPEVKNQFVERELTERALYKEKMDQWKRDKELKEAGGEELASPSSSLTDIMKTPQESKEEEKGQQRFQDDVRVEGLKETSMRHRNGFNGELNPHGEPKPHEMRFNCHLDNLTSKPSVPTMNALPMLGATEASFRRLSDLQPLNENGCNRKPDQFNDQQSHEMSSYSDAFSTAPQNPFQTFESFEDASSLYNNNLEGWFNWLERRFELLDDNY